MSNRRPVYNPYPQPYHGGEAHAGRNAPEPATQFQVVTKPVEFTRTESIEFTQESDRKCNDLCWAISFLLMFGGLITLAVVGGLFLRGDNKTSVENIGLRLDELDSRALTMCVILTTLIGLMISIIYLKAMQYAAGSIIKCSAIFGILCLCLLAVRLAFINPMLAITPGVIILINLVYLWWVWSRIPFAEVCLQISVHGLQKYCCLICLSVTASIFQVAFTFIFILSVIGFYSLVDSFHIVWPLLFCYFWTSLVISNVLHFVCCGVLAGILLGSDNGISPNLKNALTTSFGSICFGSALIALIRTLQAMARDAADESPQDISGLLFCLLACILQCLGDILDYFTNYAFVFCALYGYDFFEAGKQTFELFKAKGITALINDDLSNMPGTYACLISAVLSYFATDLLILHLTVCEEHKSAFLILAIFLGFCIPMVMFTIIESFVKTIFVIWCADPITFQQASPEEYQELVDAVNGAKRKNPERYQEICI